MTQELVEPLDSAIPAPSSTTVCPDALARLVFREVLAGDRRKFNAESNDADSGGGARDFRFRPYDRFDGVFERMLPGRRTEMRQRNGTQVPEEIYTSTVNVMKPDGTAVIGPIEFEPPTSARSGEGRLTRLSHYGLEVPSETEGRIFLLLYQTHNGRLWLTFATENQLISQQWDNVVTDLLIGCMNAPRPRRHAAQGFLDTISGSRYCKSRGD